VQTTRPTHDELLRTRVSDLLAADGRCLDVLVRHGFTPLRQPALRRVLAHTVDLRHAVMLRGLGAAEEAALLAELAAVLAAPEPAAGEGRAGGEASACP